MAMVVAATVLASVKGTGKAALSMIAMSSALLLLAGAFKVMASIPATSIVKVLLGFAGTLVVLGVAAAVLGPLTGGILMLSAAMVGIGIGILAAGAGLTALSAGIIALSGSLMVAGPMLVNAIVAIITSLLQACATLIPMFVNVGLDIVLNLLVGIYNKLPAIASMAILIVLKFLLTIAEMLPVIVQTGVTVIIAFINGIANAIRENSGAIIMAVDNLLASVFYLVLDVLQKIVGTIPLVGGFLSDGIEDLKGTIDEHFSEEDIAAITERSMNGATQGIENSKQDAAASAESLSDTILGSLDAMKKGFEESGDMSVESLIESFMNGQDQVSDAGSDLSDSAVEGADKEGLKTEMTTVGKYGGQGINNGLNEYKATVYNTGYAIGRAAVKGARKGLDEKSPSKAMFQVGKFADQGLINGMIFLKEAVGDSAYEVATGAVDTISAVLNDVSSIIDGSLDFDSSPTITPVLDLSNIQNGTNAIDGMLSGTRSFAFATANSAQFEANRLAQMNKIQATTTNADVVAALGLLRGDVNNLNESFLGTQVVLDSGALVGATARQMDNALGRIKVYKGRGI